MSNEINQPKSPASAPATGSAQTGVRCEDRWHHAFRSPKGVVVDFYDTGEVVIAVEDHEGKTHIWEEMLKAPNDKLRHGGEQQRL